MTRSYVVSAAVLYILLRDEGTQSNNEIHIISDAMTHIKNSMSRPTLHSEGAINKMSVYFGGTEQHVVPFTCTLLNTLYNHSLIPSTQKM